MATTGQILEALHNFDKTPPPPKRVKPLPKTKPKAKLVCVGGRIVGEADVVVSPSDPNWWRGMAVRKDGLVEVRR
jgi:hypothetical protein